LKEKSSNTAPEEKKRGKDANYQRNTGKLVSGKNGKHRQKKRPREWGKS